VNDGHAHLREFKRSHSFWPKATDMRLKPGTIQHLGDFRDLSLAPAHVQSASQQQDRPRHQRSLAGSDLCPEFIPMVLSWHWAGDWGRDISNICVHQRLSAANNSFEEMLVEQHIILAADEHR